VRCQEPDCIPGGGDTLGHDVTCTPLNSLLRRRLLTGGRSGLLKISQFRKKPTRLFYEVRDMPSVCLDSA
jgi:hypothetical protein